MEGTQDAGVVGAEGEEALEVQPGLQAPEEAKTWHAVIPHQVCQWRQARAHARSMRILGLGLSGGPGLEQPRAAQPPAPYDP